jgi:hypothetical protein
VQATLNGSLLNWAVHREGRLADWIRRDLQTLLAGYKATKATTKATKEMGTAKGTKATKEDKVRK